MYLNYGELATRSFEDFVQILLMLIFSSNVCNYPNHDIDCVSERNVTIMGHQLVYKTRNKEQVCFEIIQ